VEAARALADLVEISPQIEVAVVVSGDGRPAGSVGVPDERAGVVGRAARELVDGAAAFRHGESRVTQIYAALADGEVFAVSDARGRTVVAVSRGRSAPGLVFYDLKRCLAALEEEPHGAA
jgi:hypothetical protein